MKKQQIMTIIFGSMLALGLASCNVGGITVNLADASESVQASGTIDTESVRVAPEISGKISSLLVHKGENVIEGDVLFQLDDDMLQAKVETVQAQVDQAEAAFALAEENLKSAKNQYQITLDVSRGQTGSVEASTWQEKSPDLFDLPNWYYQKSETIAALQNEVDDAQTNLDEELDSLQKTLENTSNDDFVEAEARVGRAQVALQIADQTLEQAEDSVGDDRQSLIDEARKIYDQSKTELDAAQKAYNAMLTGTSATDVKEARARVSVAKTRLENAQDALNDMLTRDDSLQVEAARIAVNMAEKSLDQAETNLDQAKAALNEIEVQLAKTSINSAVSGVVLSNPVKAGEMVSAGSTVYEVGPLESLTLTVYITEDQFGKVRLADDAEVVVDSYPGEKFSGKVVYIADEAEFTPRNVQTVESRSTTVYAVEIELSNPDLKLKPGMPADATIFVGNN